MQHVYEKGVEEGVMDRYVCGSGFSVNFECMTFFMDKYGEVQEVDLAASYF